MGASPVSAWEALRSRLAASSFLTAPPGESLTTRTGSKVGWMFASSPVMLTQPGLDLMTEVVRERLAAFGSTQLATYGTSAVPLLGALVAAGGPGWNGLVVRKEAKAYAARRQIEGVPDPDQPVVLIDESISSGASVYRGAQVLERAGLEVVGAVCLVEFGGYGARAWFEAQGYRLETAYDVWRDLGRSLPVRVPRELAVPDAWSEVVLPDGCSPADLVRLVAVELRRSGLPPRPPATLDRDYDNAGGIAVSVRRRPDGQRLVRTGCRREPGDPPPPPPPVDVVRAAVQALTAAAVAAEPDLDALAFAVSFLGVEEPITLAGIDHRHNGLAVHGPFGKTGVALPNSPHYDDDLQQYRYARTTAGGIWRSLPHTLARVPVRRVVQTGAGWPPDGAPVAGPDGPPDEATEAVARRVRALLTGADPGPDPTPWPDQVHGVGVSLYAPQLVGCATSFGRPLADAVDAATRAALADPRHTDARHGVDPARLTAVVALLSHRRQLGRMAADRVPQFFRLGRDTLLASSGRTHGLVLADFAVRGSMTPERYVQQVLRKAGLAPEQARWTSYDTSTVLVRPARTEPLAYAHPVRRGFDPTSSAATATLAHEVASHVLHRPRVEGLPAYNLDRATGRVAPSGSATRVLLALDGVLRVGPALGGSLPTTAAELVRRCVHEPPTAGGWRWDDGSAAALLLCVSDLPDPSALAGPAQRLADRLTGLVRPDGALHAGRARMGTDLDLLSGLALTALGRAAPWLPAAVDPDRLRPVLAFVRRRFELVAPWPMVWWHLQAWAALADLVPGADAFARRLAGWALERQGREGAFLITDVPPHRLSFLTACVLEGLGAVGRWARRSGDDDLARRSTEAWLRGTVFLERLVLRTADTYADPPGRALVGAVRPTLVSSDLRVDYAGHTLLALAAGLEPAAAVNGSRSATPGSVRPGRSW